MLLSEEWGELNGGDLMMVIYQSSELRVLVFDFSPTGLAPSHNPQQTTIRTCYVGCQ
jgi:hypothetical protein